MKTTQTFATIFISIFYIFLFYLGCDNIYFNNVTGKIFSILWLFISCGLLPMITVIKLEGAFNKKLDEIKKEERVKGAKMYLDQISNSSRFKGITNKNLPIFNDENKEIGTTTVYGDLSDFLERKFKA